jgi:hypothetical protein
MTALATWGTQTCRLNLNSAKPRFLQIIAGSAGPIGQPYTTAPRARSPAIVLIANGGVEEILSERGVGCAGSQQPQP